ncbi:GntR family transcriptional regulator [Jannaschia sp. S6380]|uniref:GntR family transcriptional regulator n=1 Tax=Jannaschia sp. S6380 TaxID=2926408 RepID=UPI0032B1B87D
MSRAAEIAQDIERRIIAGDIPEGERLDEGRIAARFDVSRTPVREALRILVAGGMVEHLPRRGVFVRQPDVADLLDMFETMAEWEAVAGRLAATRMDAADIARLQEANARCAAAVEAGDTDRYYDENAVFHAIIYAGTGNVFLEQELRRLHDRLRPYRRAQLRQRGRMAQSLAEHRAITRCLREGDADGAADALRDHVAVQGVRIQGMLRPLRDRAS